MSGPLRVLVVEDSEDDARILEIELRDQGCLLDVRRVQDAESMREALLASSWDVILSDFHMAGFDALQALAIARELDDDVPFIIVSGSVGEDVAVAAMKAGANDYFRKENLARLGPAIERERRESAHRREVRRQRRLNALWTRIGALLAEPLDDETTLRRIARLTAPGLADVALVFEGTDSALRLRAWAHARPEGDAIAQRFGRRFGEEYGITSRVLSAAGGRVLEGAEFRALLSEDLDRLASELDPKHVLLLELRARGTVFGALLLATAGPQAREYADRDLAAAEELARRAAFVVDTHQLLERERQARAEAEAASRLKDEFLTTLSHELRTPLNAIVGWAHVLKDQGVDPATREKALETIRRSAAAQTALIEDILDVSKLVSGQLRLSLADVNLVEVVEAAIETARPAIEAKGLQVTRELEAPSVAVRGDADRLRQVVWNLVSNAVKYGASGGVIGFSIRVKDDHVELAVEDRGPGMEDTFLPHAFGRFRQGDSSTTRRHGGLGLGLALVRHLVELHGGEVRAANREGGGAVFTVRLPRQRPAVGIEPPGAPSPRPAQVARGQIPSLDGLHVLVVDDDADSRDVVSAVLQRAGARVSAASTAEDGLSLLRRERPDVLVSDLAMPEQDGFDLLRRVRALPHVARIPALALTAFPSGDDHRRTAKAGFDAHMSKPADPIRLVGLVARLAVASES